MYISYIVVVSFIGGGNPSTRTRIGGVMVSVLASSAVYRGFEPRLGQTKDYTICICCFSAKHAVLRRKSKDWSVKQQSAGRLHSDTLF
jgi:hypothetical protein